MALVLQTQVNKIYNVFYNKLINDSQITKGEQECFLSIKKKIYPLLVNLNFNDFYLKILIYLIIKYYIKKEIYILLNNGKKNTELNDWMCLYELFILNNKLILKKIGIKVYDSICKKILENEDFCQKEERIMIQKTPNIYCRIRTLIKYFNFNKEEKDKVLNIFDNLRRKKYNLTGKRLQSVLGSVIFLFSSLNGKKISQIEISKKLNISTVSIRTRYKEIVNLI